LADPDAFDDWLGAYARAQDGGDVALLKSLFSADAKLFETPFNAPIEGDGPISALFAEIWARIVGRVFEIEKIADGWAHWTAGGRIEALDEPHRTNGVLKAELDSTGRCTSLTFWTETLSVRESDMLSQRDA
jgi:hypothetical protein